MKANLREIKKEVDQKSRRHYPKDEDGRAILRMSVKNDDDFLSVFSKGETPVISSDVADFIEDGISAIPPQESLTLEIHSCCIDEEEKRLYPQAIREYYTQKYIANKQELRHNFFVCLFLFLTGLATLAFGLYFSYRFSNEVGAEVIDIAAWVLLWEAVDISVFSNRALRLKERRCLACLDMKVVFCDTPANT